MKSILFPILLLALFADVFTVRAKTTTPAPDWVKPMQLSNEQATRGAGHSTVYLLTDLQMRMNGASLERYYHHAQKILTTAGLDDASQLDFSFEPSFQKLALHYVYIRRGTEIIDALKSSEVKTLPVEEERRKQIFNGTMSTIILMNDLRVGDIIDYAYSINGQNPIIQGKFIENFTLATSSPVEQLHRRLLYPVNRSLQIKNHGINLEPVMTTNGEWREYVWERNTIDAVTQEDNTPEWFYAVPYVDLCEFSSWDEVRNWALPLYQVKAPLSPELKKQIEQWRTASSNPEERFISALRFVQDEIRYLGIELGQHSHLPHDPSEVLAKRFGDCKDKSFLLMTILRALDIEASCALVNTTAHQEIENYQPSPYSFDHVIVHVSLNNKVYWVDPTASFERGDLEQLRTPDYEKALVISEGLQGLQEIPLSKNDVPLIHTREVFRAAKLDQAASLEIVTTYRDDNANGMRHNLAETPLTELHKSWLNYYAEDFPSIKSAGEPKIDDNPQTNILIITENYQIPDFWKDQRQVVYAELIRSYLKKPTITQRSQPLSLYFPLHVAHTIEVHLPPNFAWGNESEMIKDEAIKLDYHANFNKNILTLDYRLKTLKNHIPVEKIASYFKTLDKMLLTTGIKLEQNPGSVLNPDSALSDDGMLVGLGILGVLSAIPVIGLVGWLVVKSRKKVITTPIGTSVTTPISLLPLVSIPQYLQNYRCPCKQLFLNPEHPLHEEIVRFDGKELTSVQLHCKHCSHQQNLYFERK